MKNSGISTIDCFPDVGKPIVSGKGKVEEVEDYMLNKYLQATHQNDDMKSYEIV